MKTIIVYKSYHRKNTEKVAKATAEAINARVAKVEDVRSEELATTISSALARISRL